MFKIAENNRIGQLIGQLQTTDNDVSAENSVTFRFDMHSSDPNEENIILNPQTGELFANASFDREKISQYKLFVVAYDPRKPSLSSSATVSIDILYVNFFVRHLAFERLVKKSDMPT